MKELKDKREKMTRESWIKNVMRIYPNKSRQETEELYDKIFNDKSKQDVDEYYKRNSITTVSGVGIIKP